jgi:hypothetical protein
VLGVEVTTPDVNKLEDEVAELQAEIAAAEKVNTSVSSEPTPVVVVEPTVSKSNLFKYTEDTPRVYLDRSLVVHKGDVVEWANGAPDVCWVPVSR